MRKWKKCLRKRFPLNEPVVVECDINPDEKVYPMVPPGAAIDDLID